MFDDFGDFTPYLPVVYAIILIVPFIIPRLFWKYRNDKSVKIIFYNVVKESENAFIDEPTSISFYDPDDQVVFEVEDIYDDDAYEEVSKLLQNIGKKYQTLYLVNFNEVEHCDLAFKLIFEDILEDMNANLCFIDMKVLFYYLHQQVSTIDYNGIIGYYKIPKLDCPVIEYSAIFEQLLLDYDQLIRDDMGKLFVLYEQINPLIKN